MEKSVVSFWKKDEGPKRKNRWKTALRASVTGEVVMDGVEVGDDALLPHVSGLKARLVV